MAILLLHIVKFSTTTLCRAIDVLQYLIQETLGRVLPTWTHAP